ncbi:MAG: type II toxin-antitoxin system prevent-host-death family antitoxin [Pseudomonadota bacterium]|jgi:prevent-host-death family protein
MKDINVSTLRQHLPRYLARVERRETVRVTVRGKVIAEIVPPRAEPDQAETARARLRGSVVRYDAPFEPVVPPEEWEANR